MKAMGEAGSAVSGVALGESATTWQAGESRAAAFAGPVTTWNVENRPLRTRALIAATVLGVSTLTPGASASSPRATSERVLRELFPPSSSPQSSYLLASTVRVRGNALAVLPSTGEQLAAIQSAFNLNKSQLAEVCSVQRQTIYDWYAARFEADGDNARRLGDLYRLTTALRAAGLAPLPRRAIERGLSAGGALLDILRRRVIDVGAVKNAVKLLQPAESPVSARAQRERLGWKPLTEDERSEQLDANLADLLEG